MNWFGTLWVWRISWFFLPCNLQNRVDLYPARNPHQSLPKTAVCFWAFSLQNWVHMFTNSQSKVFCDTKPEQTVIIKATHFSFLVLSFFSLSHFYNCYNDNNNKVIIENFRYLEKTRSKISTVSLTTFTLENIFHTK